MTDIFLPYNREDQARATGGLGPTTVVEGHPARAIRGLKNGRSVVWAGMRMGLPPKPE